MAIFKQLDDSLSQLLALLNKDERWLIVINADPDSLASAMALKRIFTRRVLDIGIGQINEVKRPDNLAMIRYLRIPTRRIIPNL
ncbi:MAG: phosphoesterase, partial [Desulfovibrionaceae bacterium]|nr:phosphoesterase [Desulfovibrionaceae bacterium]